VFHPPPAPLLPTELGPTVRFADHLPEDFDDTTLRADVLTGLGDRPLRLPPKWFYDKVGSELFDEITAQPEYYPTRYERRLLHRHAEAVLATAGCSTLVELGSGSSDKTRVLLDALGAGVPTDPRHPVRYVALDVSTDALFAAAEGLLQDYPDLVIDLVRADFETQLPLLPRTEGTVLIAFLGGTIGNLDPAARDLFLRSVREVLRPGEHVLLGTGLVTDVDTMVRAYDDPAGVTAAFNRNVLDVLNRRLGADFDPGDFTHVSLWDPRAEWIEMRLRARRDLRVRIPEVDLDVHLVRGEEIRTEISAKFRRPVLSEQIRAAGFASAGWWSDPTEAFALSLWRAE
jgi:L-histidine N-alpha-methyltransferase